MKPRRRRPFVDLRSAEIQTPAAPRLFLGRFDARQLRAELEDAGVLQGLAERGYPDVTLLTDYLSGEHRLRIDSVAGGPSLVDLRLAEATSLSDEPLLREHGLELLSFLSIHWMSLQDPAREFTPERPQLPGQQYPGLGLSRPILERLLRWANDWGKDGLLNLPQYYHNAVFYSSSFKFIAPVRQGRFLAMRRDLESRHVARASLAVEAGLLIEEPWGARVRWEPAEMILPLTPGARAAFESPAYRDAAAHARASVRFRLNAPAQSGSGPIVSASGSARG